LATDREHRRLVGRRGACGEHDQCQSNADHPATVSRFDPVWTLVRRIGVRLRIKLAIAFAVLVGVGCGASTYVYLDRAELSSRE
jgi:hypothetical protein